jgi:hypothetical protein
MTKKLAARAKAAVALAGSIATALLGIYTTDSTIGRIATIVVAIATAAGVHQVENAKED